MTATSKRVFVSPVLIEAAKLRKTVNDRLGVPTSPVTEKIAKLAGRTAFDGELPFKNGHLD